MTRAEAEAIVAGLSGWNNVWIIEDSWGWYITAREPLSGRRMCYNSATGYFE